jgi:menaquinone-dependent protoporphyrinogen oxidase
MAKVLVAYCTREGQTEKIAEEIGRELREAGHEVDVEPVARKVHNEGYDAVIVGASIHEGHYDDDALHWSRDHAARHDGLSAFFSVCLTAAHEDEESVKTFEGYVHDFLGATRWSPDFATTFAGATNFSKYGFFRKRRMKKEAEEAHLPTDHDVEYTSWASVAHFATDIEKALSGG